MSGMFTRTKEKRSRSTCNQANSNSSFVKNVTSRVSGLLPSTITKWFSSSSTSSANGSAPAADATDSSTEDEAPESPITTQPPSKRMRFNSPGKYNHFPSDVSSVPTTLGNFEQCAPYNNSSVQSPPGRTTFRRETNFVSTPVRSPTVELPIDKSEGDSTVLKTQHTLSSKSSSIAMKRKSIFDTNNEASNRACAKTASNTIVDHKEPCFKPSLYGSPFYPGQTVYGGASSTYINKPNIKHRKVAMVNESNNSDNTCMSYSARRVMDLLENYSTPLIEAKRILPYVSSYKNDGSNESKNTNVSPYTTKVMSYKTQELHVPNIASVLRLKHKSRLMDTTNAARQIMASHSSSDMAVQTDYVPYPSPGKQRDQSEKETSNKFTTKVKSRLTRPKRGESDVDSQIVTPVTLPTAVLQIDKDNMPKFSFGTMSTTNTPPSTTSGFSFTSEPISKPVPETVTRTGDIALSKPELTKSGLVSPVSSYKFSSPVRLSVESTPALLTLPEFTFGIPDLSVDKPMNMKDDNSSCVVGASKETEKISVPKTKDWKCADCWVLNKTDVDKCVCCGGKKPPEETAKPSKCSICKLSDSQSHIDKCVICEKGQQSNSTMPIPIKKLEDSSKWTCGDCWVKNDENDEKCVCCGGKNPKKSSATQNLPSVENTLKSNNSSSEWKCDDCWIKNKSNVDKCVACGGAKPGSKPTSAPPVQTNYFGSTVVRTLDSKTDNTAKLQTDCWECTICSVKNEKNRTTCFCCQSAKPGTVEESALKFNFGKTPNISFKFGIDPEVQENKTSRLSEDNTPEDNTPKKPEQSETNNNTLPKTPSFSFGIPPKKADDQIDTAKATNSEPAKLNFSFGVPKTQASTEPAVTPVFGSANKLSENIAKKIGKEDEKLQEVPKVEFTLPAPKEANKPLTGIFGSPLGSPISTDKVASVPSLMGSTSSTEKKDTISNSLGNQSVVTSIQETSAQNSLTFTGSGIKPAANPFTGSTSVTAFQAPATTTMSLFQKPETASTPSISLFQKTDASSTSTASLFQKSDTTTTTSPSSLAVTAPMFSFGGTATPAVGAPQSEKPKFNFSFGGNKPMFNSSFGAPSTDSSNKFSFSGNRLSTGNNGLSSGNTLAGANALTPNKLGTTNELPTNSVPARNELQQPATGLFGSPVQSENLWSSSNNNTSNLFVSNTSNSPMQKPAAFTFGSSTPFNASGPTPAFGSSATPAQNAAPAFGSSTVPAQNATPAFGSGTATVQNATPAFGSGTATVQNATPAFGSSAAPAQNATPAFGSGTATVQNATPAFGSSTPSGQNSVTAFATPPQNMFGMNHTASSPPPLFSTPVQNPAAPSMFSNAPAAGAAAPSMGLFGSAGVNPAPSFGSSNATAAPALTANAPAFNFGVSQSTAGIFGFGSQPQQAAQPAAAGVYSFGAAAAPQVQFNMGSAPNTGVRRVRKAVRRNPQR